ncbi:hypothetical protein OF846_000675 [Rhodotorula toruloides]|nr:hypothetical protein OF846_000675 [Rhodotorula toruloides]
MLPSTRDLRRAETGFDEAGDQTRGQDSASVRESDSTDALYDPGIVRAIRGHPEALAADQSRDDPSRAVFAEEGDEERGGCFEGREEEDDELERCRKREEAEWERGDVQNRDRGARDEDEGLVQELPEPAHAKPTCQH